jgi:hypothetical protein
VGCRDCGRIKETHDDGGGARVTVPDLRWESIVVGALVYLLLGEAWYSRLMIRVAWRRWVPDLSERVRRDLRSSLVPAIYAIVMSWLTALAIATWNIDRFGLGVLAGLAILLVTKLFSVLTYAGTKGLRTPEWWIHSVYQSVTLGLIGGMLATWP